MSLLLRVVNAVLLLVGHALHGGDVAMDAAVRACHRAACGAQALVHAAFLAHPRASGETYLVHAGEALTICCQLALACAAVFVHAIVPGLFQTYASETCTAVVVRVCHRKLAGPR